MKVYELLEKEQIREFRNEINLFAEKVLESYLQNLGSCVGQPESKEIFDPIWGPVELNAGEIILLDSPIIQRLRKIKQLGLASYVYCGADYSRFSHTLGVFWLANEMAEIIHKQLVKARGEDAVNFIQIVRLAALFHDTGHMFFSHVTERYFVENDKCHRFHEIKKAIEVFCKAIDDNVSLHEMISVMIVNSPAVKKLLLKVAPVLEFQNVRSDEDITKITEYISCLIIGQANDAFMLPYYQIINGPIDADKCDYLSRDSHATNIPVAVDIFRLIHKLSVTKDKLPDTLPDTKLWEDDKNGDVYYPTIKSSATEALNQLMMARSIMYNSVYYHQKVRTAETMFRSILEDLNEIKVEAVRNFTEIMLITDDVFGYYCFSILSAGCANQKQLRHITEQLNRINFRMLYKRACSIDMEQILSLSEEKEFMLDRHMFMLSNSNAIKRIERETKEQYNRICSLLNKEDSCDCSFMIMDFPKVRSSDSIPNIYISYGNGAVRNYSEIFQAGTWIESKESRHREQYLVSNCEHRELAFLALQKVLYATYGAYLLDSAAACSKVSPEEIKKRKRRLLSKNYYSDALMLASEIIIPDFDRKIDEVCRKYQTYEGAKGKIITKENLNSFLLQFLQIHQTEDNCRCLLDGVLKILLHGIYIDRKTFGSKMELLFQKIQAVSQALYVCPLGSVTDSGVHMTYYLNDLNGSGLQIQTYSSLQEALYNSKKGDSIVLFDDGAYSGKQIGSILEEYMGVPEENRLTQESHVKPLTEEEKRQIKERNVYIAYICLNAKNSASITKAAKDVGIQIKSIEYIYDMQEKAFDKDLEIFEDDHQRDLLKECFYNIGLQILTSVKKEGDSFKKGWTQERAEKGALGYNDAQQMVILKSSVPTYTMTAFWLEGGIFEGNTWNPLFARTNKP